MQDFGVAQYPVWTIVCYLGAIWVAALALLSATTEMRTLPAMLVAIIGATLSSVVALRARGLTASAKNPPPIPGAVVAQDQGLNSENWAVLDAVPEAIAIVGRNRDIRWANRAAKSMLELDLTGRPLLSVFRDPLLTDSLEALWRTGASSDEIQIHFGRDRILSLELGLMGTGEDAIALMLMRDVSGERRLESLRSDFIANVSHELKTPIAALLGIIETLRGPAAQDREATERFLGIMHDQAQRMDRLVADLLSLSRIELLEHDRPTDLVDLSRVLQSVRDTLSLKIAAQRNNLELPEPRSLPRIKGAEDELIQVFQNLVANALRYGREGTPIKIECSVIADPSQISARLPALRQARAMVRLSVIDEGQGIAREHLPRLTERFYRVDPARSRQMGGTGLGLAIVKHILHRHRGTLGIESELGKGSVFSVYLPLEPSP